MPGVGGVDLVGGREREIQRAGRPGQAGRPRAHRAGRGRARSAAQNLDAAGRTVRARQPRAHGQDQGRGQDRATRSRTSSMPERGRRDACACATWRRSDRRHGGGALGSRSSTASAAVVAGRPQAVRLEHGRGRARRCATALDELRPRVEKAGATLGGPDRQLDLHRALDPRRAVRPGVRRACWRS